MWELRAVVRELVFHLTDHSELSKVLVGRVKEPPSPDPSVIYLTDLLCPCLRESYINRVAGTPTPAVLKQRVREESKKPILKILNDLGWDVAETVLVDCGDFKLVCKVDAVLRVGGKVKAVAQVSFAGVKAGPLKALVAIASLLNAPEVILVNVTPQGLLQCLKGHLPQEVRERVKQAILKHAAALHRALADKVPPPPQKGGWCDHCLVRGICHALQKIKEVTPHV